MWGQHSHAGVIVGPRGVSLASSPGALRLSWSHPQLSTKYQVRERCMILSLSGIVCLEAGSPPELVKASGQGEILPR